MNDNLKPDARNQGVEIIKRPNKLRDKVGGSADGKPGQIDPAALARASTHVARMSDAHKAQTRVDLGELQDAYRRVMTDVDNRPQHLKRVIKIADGIMTLGKTFGYDLLSDFANSLNHFLVPIANPSVAQLAVIGLHIDAMHVLVRDDIKGDGGEVGQALSVSLNMARAKLGVKRTT